MNKQLRSTALWLIGFMLVLAPVAFAQLPQAIQHYTEPMSPATVNTSQGGAIRPQHMRVSHEKTRSLIALAILRIESCNRF
jgi:hypothetical protein